MQNNPNCFHHFFTSDSYMFIAYLHYFLNDEEYFVWRKQESIDNKDEIIEEFDKYALIPVRYKKYTTENKLDERSKKLLETIFRKFGNYSINDLAKKLKPLQNLIPFRKYSDGTVYIEQTEFFKFLIDMKIVSCILVIKIV